MKQRCYLTSSVAYKDYGARGITVCDRWKDSFENFYADMGPRPSNLYSLERGRNEEGYSPDNCHWATWDEQMNNTRRNRWIEVKGKRQTITQWARQLGIDPSTIRTRLKKGWTESEAVGQERKE
jgi:hypothetical protein